MDLLFLLNKKLKFLFILMYNNVLIYNTGNISKHNSHKQKLYRALSNFKDQVWKCVLCIVENIERF